MPDMISKRRRIAIWTLIVVASLIAFASVLTTWVDRQMLDNESWKEASTDLIEDPQVRAALSVYLVDQLYANVDVASGLEERLPNNLKPLAPTLAGALRQPATDGVERLLDSPRVQQLWIQASSTAQQKLSNVLENKTGFGITTGNGVVTVDLGELVRTLGAELGLSATTLDRIPPDAGQLEVMSSDRLSAAQTGVRAVRVLSTWLLVLVLALYALAIFLARGARRETIRNVGCAFVLVGLSVLVVRRLAGNYAVDALAAPSSQDSGRRVWLISTSILAQIGWAAVLYGAIMVLGALLAGPHRAAIAVRGRIAPILNERQAIVWSSVAVVYLLLIAWGPTHALRTLWGIVLLAALIAAGIVALRHQTLREQREVAGAGGPSAVRVAGPPVGSAGG
ncbi:MAG TPA: hypothetical protein VK631_07755 [Solirubrobacteraceae bacterium]|nr:hypothetical protein [Solirubrobacteraceae bacterium]